MRWLSPSDGPGLLPGFDMACGPFAGVLHTEALVEVPSATGSILVSGRTGGWAQLAPSERGRLDGLTGTRVSTAEDHFVGALWERGLVTVDGRSPFDAASRRAQLGGAREYYTLVLLLNEGCNIACGYCYLGHAEPRRTNALVPDVARRRLEEAFETDHPGVLVDFGEIAVARGELVELLQHAADCGLATAKPVWFSIQTNGTTLDDELCAVLARYDVLVSISLDGPARLHDAARTWRNGRGTHDEATAAIRRARAAGLTVNLIATIGQHNVEFPDAVVDEILWHRPDRYLLKPVLAQGEAATEWERWGISDAQYSAFIGEAMKRAATRRFGLLDQSALKFLWRTVGDARGWRDGCTSRACGSGRDLHVVAANGDLHACPRFVQEDHHDSSNGRANVVIGAKPQALRSVDLLEPTLREAPPTCLGCPWLQSCGGGCTLAGQGAEKHVPLPDPHCGSYMTMHSVLFDVVIPRLLESPAIALAHGLEHREAAEPAGTRR